MKKIFQLLKKGWDEAEDFDDILFLLIPATFVFIFLAAGVVLTILIGWGILDLIGIV